MIKILFLTPYPTNSAPSQRFRFEQYLLFLRKKDISYKVVSFLDENTWTIFYKKGYTLKKVIGIVKGIINRHLVVFYLHKYDKIFIHREACLVGPAYFEWLYAKVFRKKIIYDFDDAIWIKDVSDANKRFEFLKDYGKTAKIIKLCDMIFAGNQYLSDYASSFNNNIKIIPTTIDTDEYVKQYVEKSNKICIGWSGSITTIQHFELAIPFLKEVKNKFGNQVEFKVIGDANYVNEELSIRGLAWNKQTEIEDLCAFDIGIMPLPNDEWANGKCGLKGLQYMALEIPTIMSPVGVNSDIITDGVNGFLASEIDEWVEKLSLLINDLNLRKSVGIEARKTVVEKYSVEANKQFYLKWFNELLNLS